MALQLANGVLYNMNTVLVLACLAEGVYVDMVFEEI